MQVSYWTTTDTKLATVLATCGVPFRNPEPISRVIKNGKERCHYWFLPTGAGGLSTSEIAAAFHAGQEVCEALRDKLPDLPGARACAFNREALLDCVFNKCRPKIQVTLPNGAVMLADKELTDEVKKQVADLVL